MIRSGLGFCALVAVALATGPAAAEIESQFRTTPSRTTADAAWPAEAARSGLEGKATALCEIGSGGVLTGCRVLSERPTGAGFGDALLGLAPLYHARGYGNAACRSHYHEAVITWEWVKPDHRAAQIARPVQAPGPAEALKRRIAGSAVIECLVGEHGDTQRCDLLHESPAGLGYGEAAQLLPDLLRFRPATAAGHPVPSWVTIPLNYNPSEGLLLNCR
jgi:hypothetical protein